jgi:branched-chain amino acid transport system ATP-binding protein
MILELGDVHTYYGQSHILQGVSLTVAEGEMVALLGRNGAGKTTTMRSIMGLTPLTRGSIRLDGVEVSRQPPHALSRRGIAFVPSGRRIFSALSVWQNLVLADKRGRRVVGGWTIDRVFALFPKLHELQNRQAGFLSGGEQQMLKLGRALLGNPRLLLLDEPTEGLAPVIVREFAQWIVRLQGEGLSILLSEQNSHFALSLAVRGYILEKGRIRFHALADELRGSDEIQTYLGVAARLPQKDGLTSRAP